MGAVLIWRFNVTPTAGGFSEKIQFPDGRHKRYYPGGVLLGEWSYKNDKLHGEGIEYYPNGKKKYVDFWMDGDLVWRQTYDTNGVLVNTFGNKPAASAN